MCWTALVLNWRYNGTALVLYWFCAGVLHSFWTGAVWHLCAALVQDQRSASTLRVHCAQEQCNATASAMQRQDKAKHCPNLVPRAHFGAKLRKTTAPDFAPLPSDRWIVLH